MKFKYDQLKKKSHKSFAYIFKDLSFIYESNECKQPQKKQQKNIRFRLITQFFSSELKTVVEKIIQLIKRGGIPAPFFI